MTVESNHSATKWRRFRWIPILFVISLLISLIALFFWDNNLGPTAYSLGQTQDPLFSLMTVAPARLMKGIPLALLFALLVTGIACTVYVAIKRPEPPVEHDR